MSSKHKFISAITLALAVGSFTTFVSAQDSSTNNEQDSTKKERNYERRGDGMRGKGMRGGKQGGDRMLMGALHRLNLSDAQKAQVKTIFENNKPNQAQREEMRDLRQKKHDGSITEQEQAKFKEIKTQMRASAEQTHNAVLAVLTAEQRTQLDQMKQEMRERRGTRKGMRKDRQTPDTSYDN